MKDKQIAALLRVLNSQQKQLTSQQEQIKTLTNDFVKQGELIATLTKSLKQEEE